ncbi:MAG: hypothetical protein HQ478_02235 [Chloroflexi bacterium]|nr:hypothetical protein [Chloroflexota bacterium]
MAPFLIGLVIFGLAVVGFWLTRKPCLPGRPMTRKTQLIGVGQWAIPTFVALIALARQWEL